MKDENIDSSGWSEEATSLGHAREIRFLKPVNLPGLVSTRAKKVCPRSKHRKYSLDVLSFSFRGIVDLATRESLSVHPPD
jgi:hypothetical protein